jgi:hypothetical protein
VKKLSEEIFHGCQIIHKKQGKARVSVREDSPYPTISKCLTVIVNGDLFDIEVRGPSSFDCFFKDWRLIK